MAKKTKKVKIAKGKKEKGKSDKTLKAEKETEALKEAIANASLWETRLTASETAKSHYQVSTRTLLQENEALQKQVSETEKDTIEVISFLKNEDASKNSQVCKLQSQIKELRKDHRKEKQTLVSDYTSEIERLQTIINDNSSELKLMKNELKQVNEFRKKRAQLQNELTEIKEDVFFNDKQHEDTLQEMERKFIQEKMRLQNEASRKIAELAERAHIEAVNNLDETSKSVYKENVRLNDMLEYHIKNTEVISQCNKVLRANNKKLMEEKDLNSAIVEEKIIHMKALRKKYNEVASKVSSLDHTLEQVIKENELEKVRMKKCHKQEQHVNTSGMARLRRIIDLKSDELDKVKILAKSILDQRSETETFFMDSLDLVKGEIQRTRTRYLKAAEAAYNQRMRAAHAGKVNYPKVRTFKDLKVSTNSVYADLVEAEKWDGVDDAVDISELTWEQRERVLRLLFAKMNGNKRSNNAKKKALPPIKSKTDSSLLAIKGNEDVTSTFLTEASNEMKTVVNEV